MNVFDRINEWLDRSELSWVNLLTKVLPILVPIIPAIQTKNHVISELGYDEWTGWIAAVIVEFFGYAAMYKMIQFAEYNRKYTDEKRKAPTRFAVAIYATYLAIVITFNIIPEIEKGKPGYIVWMSGLFSVLSVPAGALTAVSAVHTERQNAAKRPPRTQPNERPTEQPNEQPNEQPSRTPNEHRTNSPAEHRTNRIPQPANKHPFTPFPNTERTNRIEVTARTLEENLGRPASIREIQQALREQDGTDSGWSTSTISTALKGKQ